jgi:integrase/recombinase XerC
MKELSSFLQYIKFEKRFSPHTVTAYNHDLDQFFIYTKTAYEVAEVNEVSYSMIRSWIVSMMEEGVTPRTINRKISTLKTFYKFLLRNGYATSNPLQKIQPPKTSKRLPVFVEEKGMEFLFKEVNFGEGFVAVRDKLIMELFYATGMRLSELVNLKEMDVDLSNCQVKVLGKRNKERIIPFTNTLKNLIRDYISVKSSQSFSNSTDQRSTEHSRRSLFVNETGKPVYKRMVYNIVNKYLKAVTTIDKKSPHVLRHTFATHMLNHGADINSIKEILGHANLSATQVYTHNTIEKLKEVYKQAHPRA